MTTDCRMFRLHRPLSTVLCAALLILQHSHLPQPCIHPLMYVQYLYPIHNYYISKVREFAEVQPPLLPGALLLKRGCTLSHMFPIKGTNYVHVPLSLQFEDFLYQEMHITLSTQSFGISVLENHVRFDCTFPIQSISEWVARMANGKWCDVAANGVMSYTWTSR